MKNREIDISIDKFLIKYYSVKTRENSASYMFLPLADSYKKIGKRELAIEVCKNGLKLHPEYIGARVLLGELFFLCERYDKAEDELKYAAAKSLNNIAARKFLLKIYMKKNKRNEALKIIDELGAIYKPFLKEFKNLKDELERRNLEEAEKYKKARLESNKFKLSDSEESFEDRAAFDEIEKLFQKGDEGDGIEPLYPANDTLVVFKKMLLNINSSRTQSR